VIAIYWLKLRKMTGRSHVKKLKEKILLGIIRLIVKKGEEIDDPQGNFQRKFRIFTAFKGCAFVHFLIEKCIVMIPFFL
jgi:hypothetical protein